MSAEGGRTHPRRRAMRWGWARAGAIGLALAGGSVLPVALHAQAPGRGNGPDRAELEQRVRAQMGRMMRQRLGLDEEQAARLAEVVRDFDGRRRELFRLEQATQRRVEALVLEGVDDEAEARDLMDRMADLRMQEAELFSAEQAALLEVLTPTQVIQLQALRQDLGQRIRALRGGRGGDAAPRRDRGPRGPGRGAYRDGPRGPPGGPVGAPSGRLRLG